MLIENFVNSMDVPFKSLILLNEAAKHELYENYGELTKKVSPKVIDNLLGINFLEKLLIEHILNKKNKVKNILENNYSKMSNNEFEEDYSYMYDFE